MRQIMRQIMRTWRQALGVVTLLGVWATGAEAATVIRWGDVQAAVVPRLILGP